MKNQIKEKAGKVGGKVTAQKYGPDHFREIGRKGYLAAKAKFESQGRDFHREGGEASWKAQNLEMLRLGYFPNQSPEMWGYDTGTGAAPILEDEPPF
jgi:general stress protein YciG